MKKREETSKINKVSKAIAFTMLSLFIVLKIIQFSFEKIDEKNAEKTNISIVPIESSSPRIVLIEPQITPEPEERQIDLKILYQEDLISSVAAQGFNFSDFATFNKATVGVLAISGTNMYYPICGANNDEDWIETLFNGIPSAYGTIYLDPPSSKDFSSKVSTLFGHNMSDGRMFAGLNKYLAYPDYYKTHKYVYITTKDYINVYKFVCSARVLDSEVQTLRSSYFPTDEDFQKYLELLNPRIKYKDETIDMSDSDHLLQLITCTGSGHSRRTSVYFDYQYSVPNVMNNINTSEEIQNQISDIVKKKNNFSVMAKNIAVYKVPLESNYVLITGKNDTNYVWTKEILGEKERVAFVKSQNLESLGNYMFINGHNSFDIDGIRVIIAPSNSATDIFCAEDIDKENKEANKKELNLKRVEAGKFIIEFQKDYTLTLD